MAYVIESNHCAFELIDLETGDSILFQTDWDYPGLASRLGGWSPCDCDNSGTDGTVDCRCGRTAGEMITSAQNHILENCDFTLEVDGGLSDYFAV